MRFTYAGITQASSSHACGSHNTGRVETCQALIGQTVIHQLTWRVIKNKRYFHSQLCSGLEDFDPSRWGNICYSRAPIGVCVFEGEMANSGKVVDKCGVLRGFLKALHGKCGKKEKGKPRGSECS